MTNHLTLYQATALLRHWGKYPPLQRMIAGYFDLIPKESTQADDESDIEDIAEQIPVNTMPAAEFDALRAALGLPTE